MTLDEFKATGSDVANLATVGNIAEQGVSGAGRAYFGDLFIEGPAKGAYCLTLGNESICSPILGELEARLFSWAVFEGYLDDSAPALVEGSVAEYLVQQLGVELRDTTLNELDVGSNCGRDCVSAIDAARGLLCHTARALGTGTEWNAVQELAQTICETYWRG